MLRDVESNTSVVQALQPLNRAAGYYVSPAVNVVGARSIMVVVMVGAVGEGGQVSMEIQESDSPEDEDLWINMNNEERTAYDTRKLYNIPANSAVSVGLSDVGGLIKRALRVALNVNGTGAADTPVLLVLGITPNTSVYIADPIPVVAPPPDW